MKRNTVMSVRTGDTTGQESRNVAVRNTRLPVRNADVISIGMRSLLTVVIGIACCSCTLLFSEGKEKQGSEDGGLTDSGLSDGGLPDGTVPPPDTDASLQITTIRTIVDGTHDSLENPGGGIAAGHQWISLYSFQHRGGLNFALDDIDQGIEILDAKLEVYVDSELESSPSLRIFAEKSPNPSPFAKDNYDISSRTVTMESKQWVEELVVAGWHQSPDISIVVQEVVDMISPNTTKNSLVIILDPEGQSGISFFEIRQFEHEGEFSAKLILTYRPKS